MKKTSVIFSLLCFCLLPSILLGVELVRQKNTATIIAFPIVDADGDYVSGATGLDSEIDAWSDTVAPNGFTDCTNEAIEIGSSGWYHLSLTQAEMNNDYIVIQTKTSTSGAKSQGILIRTMVGDPLNMATTSDGGTTFDPESDILEGTLSFAAAWRLMGASLFGDVENSGTTYYFRDVADSKARITIDLSGSNRNTINLDGD